MMATMMNLIGFCFTARLFDYFDTGIMERLRHQLVDSQQSETRLGLSPLANSLTVSSQVIARRLDRNGKTRVLVRWTPEEL
jgi:zinc finger protein AEBP2